MGSNKGRIKHRCPRGGPGAVKLQKRRCRTGFFVDDNAQDTRRLVIETNGIRQPTDEIRIWLDPPPESPTDARKPRPPHHALVTYVSPSMPTHILFEKRSKKKGK